MAIARTRLYGGPALFSYGFRPFFLFGAIHAAAAMAAWIMLLSGVFGVLAGIVILTGFPMTGLWVLGFLLGVDLISHGLGWLAYAWKPALAVSST